MSSVGKGGEDMGEGIWPLTISRSDTEQVETSFRDRGKFNIYPSFL